MLRSIKGGVADVVNGTAGDVDGEFRIVVYDSVVDGVFDFGAVDTGHGR